MNDPANNGADGIRTAHERRATQGNRWGAGRQEVAFYTQVAPHMRAGLIPRCFDADWNADLERIFLATDDLGCRELLD